MRVIFRFSKHKAKYFPLLTYNNIMAEKKTNREIKERVLLVCNHLGISANKLSQDSGMSREYIRLMKDFANADFLRYIYRTYPQIDLVWLITGEGEMIKKNEETGNVSLLIKMLNDEREKVKKLEAEIAKLKEEFNK